jgi:hypothetical protein
MAKNMASKDTICQTTRMPGFPIRCALPVWRNNPELPSFMHPPSKIAVGPLLGRC